MKTALITGASAGIGEQLAQLFAEDGHSLLLVARRKERLESLAQRLKESCPQIQVHIFVADLAFPDAPQKVFDFTQQQSIQVDYLVNNAGIGSHGEFLANNLMNELAMIDLNVRSLVAMTHLFGKGMVERGFGRILNVGSTAGFQPGPFMSAYYASKAFVNSFSEALSYELKNKGVTSTVLAPGPTKTEFQEAAKMEKSPLFKKMTPASAVQVAKKGYKAMHAGQSLCVPGIINNFLFQSLRVSPRALTRFISAKLNTPEK